MEVFSVISSNDNDNTSKKHKNASFSFAEKKRQKELYKKRLIAQKNQLKLEEAIAKKIEEADKKERQSKNKKKSFFSVLFGDYKKPSKEKILKQKMEQLEKIENAEKRELEKKRLLEIKNKKDIKRQKEKELRLAKLEEEERKNKEIAAKKAFEKAKKEETIKLKKQQEELKKSNANNNEESKVKRKSFFEILREKREKNLKLKEEKKQILKQEKLRKEELLKEKKRKQLELKKEEELKKQELIDKKNKEKELKLQKERELKEQQDELKKAKIEEEKRKKEEITRKKEFEKTKKEELLKLKKQQEDLKKINQNKESSVLFNNYDQNNTFGTVSENSDSEYQKENLKQKKLEEKLRKEELKKQAKEKKLEEIRIKKEKRKEEKEALKQKKLEEQKIKDEQRKARLKEKYELEAKRKKEKEDKAILLMTEKKEKEQKLKREKEQARQERKEKQLLIKKAKEEDRLKHRNERKTFKEKLIDYYNNISFVKDRRNRREMQRQALLIDFEGADAVRSAEKVMYKYVAKNNETGKVETGYFAAFSKLDVHSFLLAENYEVYEITPQTKIVRSFSFLSPKFKATELDFFLTQLSTFLKSGITLVESVKILSKQSKKKSHKSTFKSIIYELTMGENFSEALAKQGDVFPRLLVNMVKTSELTGDLPETLDDMAEYYRATDKTRKQMISAITYPVVVLVFAIVILIFMMVKVVPQFVGIYDDLGSDLPAITKAIIGISNFLSANLWYVIAGIIIFVVIFIVLFKTIKVFKSVVQTIVMNLPIIGNIIIYNEVTMFTKTFASLLNHNVYITDCMDVLSKITNNEVYKMMIFDTITNLARGEAISNSFKNHWAFPTVAYEMILTGEKTGQLGLMMDKVADYYQDQHNNAVNQIKAFIEPVMIVVLAGIVGVILMSIVLPMFDMYQTLSSQA